MKDYLEDRYGDEKKASYDEMRVWVIEAWDMLPEDFLREQLNDMLKRIQAVIKVNRMYIKY